MDVTIWPLGVFTVLFVLVVAIAGWASHGESHEQDDSKP